MFACFYGGPRKERHKSTRITAVQVIAKFLSYNFSTHTNKKALVSTSFL